MRIPLPHRRQSSGTPATASGARPRVQRRHVLGALLLASVVAALTWPGRQLLRTLARSIDRHVEGFAEPQSIMYGRVIRPFLGRLYRRAADDVARELQGTPKGVRTTVLDVGCGTGDLALAISRKARDSRVVGIDSSPSMLLWASRHETTDGRIRFLVADGARVPLPDESVDVVVSTLSLHHLADPEGVLAEIDRVLVPGGCALIYDLGLLAPTPKDFKAIATRAGIPVEALAFENVGRGFPARLFVRYRYDRVD